MRYFKEKHKNSFSTINLLLMAVIISFFGCADNTKKEIALRIKNQHYAEQFRRNSAIIESLLQDLTHPLKERFSRLKKNCLLIDSMRVKYKGSLMRKDLLNYADTVMKHYDKAVNKDISIVKDWNTLRLEIVNADSSEVLDFYNLTLTVESELLISYGFEMAPHCGWDPFFASFTGKDHYMLNDTVNLILRSSYESLFELMEVDFKEVTCKNIGTGKVISASIERIGPQYLFIYKPKERGVYVIDGKARISTYNEWRDDAKIHHQFVVE